MLKRQTEKIVIQANDGFQMLRNDISGFPRKGFEKFEKLSEDTQKSIETIIATQLNKYAAKMQYAFSQHTQQITGLMTKPTEQIEALVRVTKEITIAHSCFTG